jgi:nucleoid-associated protein YgaU
MPRVKKQSVKKTEQNKSFFSKIKLGESYTSLIVGIIVVIVATLVVFALVKGSGINSLKSIDSLSTDSNQLPKTYVVKAGDDLWKISEKIYGSGYNWVDLAKENKLSDPSLLYVGTKLSVPNVEVKNPEKKKPVMQEKVKYGESITSDKYIVKEGDNLWDISVRAYSDGYKWTEVAKINNLTNPDLIYPGDQLILPR